MLRGKQVRRKLALASMAWLILAGCAGAPAAPPTAQPVSTTQTVRGMVVAIDPGSLSGAGSFSVLAEDGRELTFQFALGFRSDPAHPMSPGHLRLHMLTRDSVAVTFREEDGVLMATTVVD
jgi:hypothetical protein